MRESERKTSRNEDDRGTKGLHSLLIIEMNAKMEELKNWEHESGFRPFDK